MASDEDEWCYDKASGFEVRLWQEVPIPVSPEHAPEDDQASADPGPRSGSRATGKAWMVQSTAAKIFSQDLKKGLAKPV
jgi:hypothetical protein